MNTPLRTLISASELRTALAGPRAPAVIDTSFDLFDLDAGEASWREGHVPGSIYLHLERDLSGAKTAADGLFRGRHPLPDRAMFAATLARCGIAPQTPVVALDRQGGPYAARLWWMLRWMGHADAAVLDGGLLAWVAAGGALSAGSAAAPVPAAPYPERDPVARTVTADALAALLGRVRLLDARAGERFRGEIEPLDAAAGHIPGALNRFFKDNLDGTSCFKTATQLHDEFCALLGMHDAQTTVHHCGSGVTACHNLLAMEHAGLVGSTLYPGSWSEWSADAARPIAVGG